MLRGGIIGLGNVALGAHVPGWARREDVEIVAATDVRRERRAECAAALAEASWYDSAETLLARPALDFVDICTPPSSHGPLIRSALERGLHVLCEKPLVSTPDELAALAALAASRDRVLHTVHNWHHAPIVRRTTELIGEGAIGRVERIAWRTLRTAPAAVRDGGENWRVSPDVAGGGILTDHGWHVFYLVRRWIGEPPTSVRARLETRRQGAARVEDTADVEVTFPHATAEIFLTWAADERRNWAEVRGSEGRIELHDDTLVLTRHGEVRRWPCPPALSSGSVHPEWFDPVASGFVTAMRQGDGSNLAEAALCATLESLARESSRSGGRPRSIPAVMAR